jgi:DNA-binding transcriptional LysR family regulator
VPTGHRLAIAKQLRIKDLSREPLILFNRALDPLTFSQIEQLFLRVSATMNVAHELKSVLSMLNFVAMGSGCSLVPDYVRSLNLSGIVFKTVRGPNLVKSLGIIKRRQCGGLVESFYQFAIDRMKAQMTKTSSTKREEESRNEERSRNLPTVAQ